MLHGRNVYNGRSILYTNIYINNMCFITIGGDLILGFRTYIFFISTVFCSA